MSAIGSVPATPDLHTRAMRALRDLVVKSELEIAESEAMRVRNFLPPRRCICESISTGPGCRLCITKRGRRVLDEYDALRVNAPEIPDCSTCGKSAPETVAIQTDMFGGQTAQCRACYVASREREMAVSQ